MNGRKVNLSWVDFFNDGKWKDCSNSLQEKLNHSNSIERKDADEYLKLLCLKNNKFVCDQLSWSWESESEDHVANYWAKGFVRISEMHHFLRCQYLSTPIPIEVVLCITCNLMWWAVMKIDPFHQHSCIKETLNAAIFSLKAVGKIIGATHLVGQPKGFIVQEFIEVARNVITCLHRLTPIQSQLVHELIILGLFNALDCNNHEMEIVPANYETIIDHMVQNLPHMKIHFLHGELDKASAKYPDLLKFGWSEVGEILSKTSASNISETVLTVSAIFCLRQKTEENYKKALHYLGLIDKANIMYSFLFHYLHALANFYIGNLDSCLYHLQCTSSSTSNFFMQGRMNTLKGQTLLLQNKAVAALEVLQDVEYKRKEVQIPLSAYLMGKAFQHLSKVEEQADISDLLLECLSAEPAVQPKLLSPLVGMEHRLVLLAHIQPEVSYKEVLQFSAKAHLSKQPKEAAEKLLQLIHVITIEKNSDIVAYSDDVAMWEVSELLHDAATALLKANCVDDALLLCEESLRFHNSKFGVDRPTSSDLSSLQEDVIALMLLAEAKDALGSSDVSDILNRSGRLLQKLSEKITKLGKGHEENLRSCKSLLARVYLHKAILNVRRNFNDDAAANFQRALTWNEGDPEVILQFASFLLNTNQLEESLALWAMFNDCGKHLQKETDSISFNHLLGEKMSASEREEVICRLQSLSSM